MIQFLRGNKKILLICLAVLIVIALALVLIFGSANNEISIKEQLSHVKINEIIISFHSMERDELINLTENLDETAKQITDQVDVIKKVYGIDSGSPYYEKGVIQFTFNCDKSPISFFVNERGEVDYRIDGKYKKYKMKNINDTFFDELLKLTEQINQN